MVGERVKSHFDFEEADILDYDDSKIPEPRWEALEGFTSEKYKEKVRHREDLYVKALKELRKKNKDRRLAKKLLMAQVCIIGFFIGMVIGFIVVWG